MPHDVLTGPSGSVPHEGCLTSLEHLETKRRLLGTWTAAQERLHADFRSDRRRILSAFALDGGDDLSRRLDRMEDCCSFPLLAARSDGTVGLVLGCCRDRMCPRCQRGRGIDAAAKVGRLVATMDSPRFITLTLRHAGGCLTDELDRLHTAFRQLRKDRRWKARVRGGCYAVEVTFNPQRSEWHVHLHAIVDGSYYPQRELSLDWARASGGSTICDIRAVHSRRSVAKYIAAYIAKPVDQHCWPMPRLCEYARGMHGRRLLGTFGSTRTAPNLEPEPEAQIENVDTLCSIARLAKASKEGNAYATHALELVYRGGRRMVDAAGGCPRSACTPTVPLERWEHTLLIRLCEHVCGRLIADPYSPSAFADAADAAASLAPLASRPPPRRRRHDLLPFYPADQATAGPAPES